MDKSQCSSWESLETWKSLENMKIHGRSVYGWIENKWLEETARMRMMMMRYGWGKGGRGNARGWGGECEPVWEMRVRGDREQITKTAGKS